LKPYPPGYERQERQKRKPRDETYSNGTFEMVRPFAEIKCQTFITKDYTIDQWKEFARNNKHLLHYVGVTTKFGIGEFEWLHDILTAVPEIRIISVSYDKGSADDYFKFIHKIRSFFPTKMVAGGEAVIPQDKQEEPPSVHTALGPIYVKKTFERKRKNIRPTEAAVPVEIKNEEVNIYFVDKTFDFSRQITNVSMRISNYKCSIYNFHIRSTLDVSMLESPFKFLSNNNLSLKPKYLLKNLLVYCSYVVLVFLKISHPPCLFQPLHLLIYELLHPLHVYSSLLSYIYLIILFIYRKTVLICIKLF
jgi:hypothetical protein